ncbi:MAG: D-alanyl-D-alanine carboxypeptidase [Lachnospiraceae bacterium]|nr:D-alanyl-D-alanine carboxypeptidase [Lachnospiraceae bacterium]
MIFHRNIMKRYRIKGLQKKLAFLLVFLLLVQQPGEIGRAETSPEPSDKADITQTSDTPEELQQLYARSAVLIDGDSGRVLFGKEEKEVLPMASTTKIMTCILALELCEENELCQVSREASSQPQVRLGMQAGETYYLGDLLYSLMLESHNDTAVCIAEHVSGSVEGFALKMNRKAKEIGCRQTYYITPNGLDSQDAAGEHSTTAEELALVMRYCIMQSPKKSEFIRITQTPQHNFTDTAGKRSFYCANHNAFLNMMDGVISGKTGFTGNAGYCYVGAAEQNGKTLIVALLACGWPGNKTYKWKDTRKLLEYGFSHYEKYSADLTGLKLPEIPVLHGIQDKVPIKIEETVPLSFALLLSAKDKLQLKPDLPPSLEAPITKGARAGHILCILNGEIYARYPLVFESDVKKITFLWWLEQIAESILLQNPF